MEHEALLRFAFERVYCLLVGARPERRNRKALCLAAGEEPRTVRPWQHPDLAGYLAYLVETPSVNTQLTFDYELPDILFLSLHKRISNVLLGVFAIFGNKFFYQFLG